MGAIGRATLPTQGSTDLLGLVLHHAHDRPLQLALKDDSESFNYAQLAERVASVAAGLAALGVVPGDRVALHLGNSAAFVTSALGCLWAGVPFVPLAPDSPPARLDRQLQDCEPALVVASDRDEPSLPSRICPIVTVEEMLAGPRIAPPRCDDPGRDAYLIYTSGTSGVPKGVTITERALHRSVATTTQILGLDGSTRGLAVSGFHFDGSYGLVFPTLLAGGALLVPRRESILFLRRFYQLVSEEQITLTSFSPSYLRLVVSSRHVAKLAGSKLNTVMLGGEQCVAEDVAKLWEVVPAARVFNRYGPTEATIAVTTYEVTRDDVATGRVPLGGPHPGVEFFIVSDNGVLVEGSDEEGELYIAGEQLMRGYWGDEELSRQVLREDIVPDQVLYKTGDLVCRDRRGRYFYLGRLDDVVKRNGIRISLTEIAQAFRRMDGVTGAFCAFIDKGGSAGIAAFVETSRDLDVAELLGGASRQLPPGALPDEVLVVNSLPMTAQGKVDRRRLLADSGRTGWQEGRSATTVLAPPLVSIVIPTYQSNPPFLAEALASVIGQDWANWEVIVVDDGSPDPDALKTLVSVDPRVRLVRSDDRSGAARARNLGLEQAQGELVAFLDNDDIWYPERLSTTIQALAHHKEAVGAYTAFDVVRGADKEHLRTRRQQGPTTRHTVLSGGNRPNCSVVVRREALAAVGGFDPAFEGAEDVDLVRRLVELGPYVYVDKVTWAHRRHDHNYSDNTRFVASAHARSLAAHMERARAVGDADAVADLESAQRQVRRYYSAVALRAAFAAAKSGDLGQAAALFSWGVRFSPSGATSMATGGAVRKLKRALDREQSRNDGKA